MIDTRGVGDVGTDKGTIRDAARQVRAAPGVKREPPRNL
jgi:hypothetical protein